MKRRPFTCHSCGWDLQVVGEDTAGPGVSCNNPTHDLTSGPCLYHPDGKHYFTSVEDLGVRFYRCICHAMAPRGVEPNEGSNLRWRNDADR